MPKLAEQIKRDEIAPGCLAIYWLSQAGFVFKSSGRSVVYIDPYFSDVVERTFGFKRMMPCPIAVEDVTADLIVCTHEHLDHMDTDALPILAAKSGTLFAGPVECIKEFKKAGVPDARCHLLDEGVELNVNSIKIKGVYADHGALAPDAIGVLLDLDGVRVYHTGDTAFHIEEFEPVAAMHPDIMLPCINGQYGNMNAEEAAHLVRHLGPRVAIASHFWMFVEHGGDPSGFLEHCSRLAPNTKAMVMKPGERFLFNTGEREVNRSQSRNMN